MKDKFDCIPTSKGNGFGGNLLPYSLSSEKSFITVDRMTNDPLAAYNVSVDCGQVRFHRIGDNFLGNMTCPGDAYGQLKYQCPGREERPICAFWDGEKYRQDPMCWVEKYDADTTVCVCNQSTLSSSSGRVTRRLSEGFVSSFTELSSVLVTYDTNFNYDWVKNPRAVFVRIPNAFIISITTFFLLALIIGFLIYLGLDSTYDMAKQKDKNVYKVEDKMDYKTAFNNLIPLEFQFRPWLFRFYDAMKINHIWIGVCRAPLPPSKTFGDDTHYRSIKWFMAMFRIVSFIFINTVLARMYYSDDGQCEAYLNIFDCLEPRSVDFVNDLCSWDSYDRTCHFKPPGVQFYSILFLTAAISIASVPLDKLAFYMISRVKDLLEDSVIDKRVIEKTKNIHWQRELETLQTPIGTMFRGTRLRYMQSEIDHVKPEVIQRTQ